MLLTAVFLFPSMPYSGTQPVAEHVSHDLLLPGPGARRRIKALEVYMTSPAVVFGATFLFGADCLMSLLY